MCHVWTQNHNKNLEVYIFNKITLYKDKDKKKQKKRSSSDDEPRQFDISSSSDKSEDLNMSQIQKPTKMQESIQLVINKRGKHWIKIRQRNYYILFSKNTLIYSYFHKGFLCCQFNGCYSTFLFLWAYRKQK